MCEKRKINGEIKNTKSNKKSGISSEVYPFYDNEIVKMIEVFDTKIFEAKTDMKIYATQKNKLMFLIGINIGIRASEIRELKWSFFFDYNGNWKEYYIIKTNKNKIVKLFFNDEIKKYINDFILLYPIENYDSYIFAVRNNNPITIQTMWNVITETAKNAGIEKNIGTHSLRKTWGYRCWEKSDNKENALIIIQMCFNHQSTLITQRYIGLIDKNIKNSNEINRRFSSQELSNRLILIDNDEDMEINVENK